MAQRLSVLIVLLVGTSKSILIEPVAPLVQALLVPWVNMKLRPVVLPLIVFAPTVFSSITAICLCVQLDPSLSVLIAQLVGGKLLSLLVQLVLLLPVVRTNIFNQLVLRLLTVFAQTVTLSQIAVPVFIVVTDLFRNVVLVSTVTI